MTIGSGMATANPPPEAPVRADVVAAVRARLASGERANVDDVALAVIAWTCRPCALAS